LCKAVKERKPCRTGAAVYHRLGKRFRGRYYELSTLHTLSSASDSLDSEGVL